MFADGANIQVISVGALMELCAGAVNVYKCRRIFLKFGVSWCGCLERVVDKLLTYGEGAKIRQVPVVFRGFGVNVRRNFHSVSAQTA